MATVQNSRRLASERSRLLDPLILLLSTLGIGVIALAVVRLQTVSAVLPMLAICSLCLGVLVLVRPEVGLFAIVVCAAFVKVQIGTGTGSSIVMSLVCAFVLLTGWLAHQILNKQPVNRLSRWVSVPILFIVGFTLLSWVWGRVTLDPRVFVPEDFYRVQAAQTVLIIVSVSMLFVGADLFRRQRLRNALMAAVIVIGFLDLLFRVVLPQGVASFVPSALMPNTFGLFGVWFVALCWANAVLNERLPAVVRIILAAGATGWLVNAIIISGIWISGWLPLVIAVVVISFVAGPRIAVPFMLAVSACVALFHSYFFHLLFAAQVEEGSIGGDFGRLELWKRNLEFSQDWFLLGSGPAGYALYYMTFIPNEAMSTHSNYVDLLSQIGIGGLLSFVVLLSALMLLAIRIWRRLDDSQDRALCASILGGIPALMFAMWFGDWVIPFVYNQTIAGFDHSNYSWLMLAALAGLIAQKHPHGDDDG